MYPQVVRADVGAFFSAIVNLVEALVFGVLDKPAPVDFEISVPIQGRAIGLEIVVENPHVVGQVPQARGFRFANHLNFRVVPIVLADGLIAE